MEKIMNILYYGIFKILCKGTRIIDFTMVWYYKLPFVKKRLAKFGYTPKTAKEFLNAMWNSPEDGWNTHYALWPVCVAVGLYLVAVFYPLIKRTSCNELVFIPIGISLFSLYWFLFKETKKGKEKYLIYFVEFEKKSHKTKVWYGIMAFVFCFLPYFVVFVLMLIEKKSGG